MRQGLFGGPGALPFLAFITYFYERSHMDIHPHFRQETLEENNVFLDDEEVRELAEAAQAQIDAVRADTTDIADAEIIDLMALAFLAGRSCEVANRGDGNLHFSVSPQTASRLLEFLLQD